MSGVHPKVYLVRHGETAWTINTATSWVFAMRIETPFWVTASLLGLGAVAALRVSNTLKEVTHE